MSYRVCIPCAGTGSRLGGLTQFINKSLISIANRPTLSHLIEQFPSDAEFVLALGHKGHLIREFLELAYPDRKFFYAEVSLFEGPGSGLGLSLQACKQYLQQPFIFISCDTLVDEPIPAPDKNWMGYAEANDIDAYRTLGISSGFVTCISEKGLGQHPEHKAYIGIAGILSYDEFWIAMQQGGEAAIETGEAHGMRSLLTGNIQAHRFTWHDAGNPTALASTRNRYQNPDEPNILEKENEAIWFIGDTVIKFSDDEDFIANRVRRVAEMDGYIPEVTGSKAHMYRYTKAQGKVLSEVITIPLFDRLLDYCVGFWQKKPLTPGETNRFRQTCLKFYREKTLTRVELFYKNFGHKDVRERINGKTMPKLEALLNALDWNWLANGSPGRFHGDFHFENILWDGAEEKFIFLDWRQDFGGNLNTGDIYYDLAKLLHGLLISHEIITRNLFSAKEGSNSIEYDFHRKHILVECQLHFQKWLRKNNYDEKKVRTLTALIYLNIAALHHYPYSLLLYALGKDMLSNEAGPFT